MTRLSGYIITKPLLHSCMAHLVDAVLLSVDTHVAYLVDSTLLSADKHTKVLVNAAWLSADSNTAQIVNAAFLSADSKAITGVEEFSKYKQQVVEMLRSGQLVVQMLAAEENILMPDGSRKATFTQETWDMVRPLPCTR